VMNKPLRPGFWLQTPDPEPPGSGLRSPEPCLLAPDPLTGLLATGFYPREG
jgi:hypothetical protein